MLRFLRFYVFYVGILNETILNIMSNFAPNEIKTVYRREPEWMNTNIKKLSRKKTKNLRNTKIMGIKVMTKQFSIALEGSTKILLLMLKKTILRILAQNLPIQISARFQKSHLY